ncbi:MAG: DUF1080 domain-containing protein [Bacteroidia bacterium]|nr:DUF1080 domain-containing protein [Bacteroidia bacterium]
MISGFSIGCAQITDGKITTPEPTEVWEPQPRVVSPGEAKTKSAPSDAIVLFDGKNLDQWCYSQSEYGPSSPDKQAGWEVKDGVMTVVPGAKHIATKKKFGSMQLHIEWKTPEVTQGKGQDNGNSGVFFQQKYELQILGNYKNKTYANGQAGSIYKQSMPLVNASRPKEEWQSYDVIYMAPEFNEDGIKVKSAFITVFHNGVLVQNHTEIKGTTEYIGMPKNNAHGKGPLCLQDHGNKVSYRNIWVRELK